MGSAEDENERDRDEGPQHEVCFQPFEIGRYELTFAQWDACVADGGCEKIPSDEGWGRGQRPVINISWQQAQEYLKWLNNCGGQTGYRLPTEAEWEYAARAGTTTPFSTGECISTDQANFDGTFEYAGCPEPTNLDLHQTQPVGSYPPNAWGVVRHAWQCQRIRCRLLERQLPRSARGRQRLACRQLHATRTARRLLVRRSRLSALRLPLSLRPRIWASHHRSAAGAHAWRLIPGGPQYWPASAVDAGRSSLSTSDRHYCPNQVCKV